MGHPAESIPIPYLSPEQLSESFLVEYVYPNKKINYYWSDCWEPSFYMALARAGFISLAMDHKQLGPLLMPEIQRDYAVLDWDDLHVSRKVKKILNQNSFDTRGFSFAQTTDPEEVMKAIMSQFGQKSWLSPAYKNLMKKLHKSTPRPEFTLQTVELRQNQQLIAGELGYSCGTVYTSLSGFSSRKKEHNNMGKVQLVLLARYLKEHNYAFWNLGHPFMDYKTALGARVINRETFLKRWLPAVNKTLSR